MRYYTCDKSNGDKIKYYVTSKLSENIHETPEGFLVCIGVPIARTGEMVYGEGETPLETDDSGKVLINREEDEVFSKETIASFEGKPITITHPKDFVSPENWSRLAKGVLQNVRRGEGENKNDLLADLLITDSLAINLVKNGLREVSCGYEADYVQTDDGKGIQKNIIGNHLALVEQGRAGSAYAINDHKSKGDKMGLKEKLLAKLGFTKDSVMAKAIDEAFGEEEKKDEKSKDAGAYDELVKMVDALGEKISAMSKPKDEEKEKPKDEFKKEDKKDDVDDDSEKESSIEERLKAVELLVKKLLEKGSQEAGDEDESEDADFEESEDAKEDEEKESKDAGVQLTGDEMSRAEILAPGIKASKDLKVKALKKAYETKEGKKVIDSITGGKAPKYSSPGRVETIFNAASELLKSTRNSELSKTKTHDSNMFAEPEGFMTAEKMNEINAKFYTKN